MDSEVKMEQHESSLLEIENIFREKQYETYRIFPGKTIPLVVGDSSALL